MRSKKPYRESKRRNLTPLFIYLLLSPFIVGFSSDSTSAYSELLVGAGGGEYVYHDCSGTHKRNFVDAGLYLGRKFESPFRIGVSFGGFGFPGAGVRGGALLFPDLAFDWEYISFGTTGVRFGSLNEMYLEGKWLDQPPLLSGKGLLRYGIGGYIRDLDSRFWLGVNGIPYSRFGPAVQWEVPFGEKKYLFFNGRYGTERESGIGEFGLSMGIRIVTY
jgi:hypothetical protein